MNTLKIYVTFMSHSCSENAFGRSRCWVLYVFLVQCAQ